MDDLADVTLYSKQDCPLCDEARTALERVRGRIDFDLREVDITSDRVLETRYRERIPVIAVDGADLFDYHVDEHALEQRLAEAQPKARPKAQPKAAPAR
jgi:glutaredoxin